MKKIAKLVYMSMVTRVIVDENATEEQIVETSKSKFIEKVQNDLHENLEEIVDDDEMPYGETSEEKQEIEKEKNKPLIEQECMVDVEYTDMDGVKRITTIQHNGEEDCWDGIDLNESEGIDKTFDFNTFGGLGFGDSPDDFKLNAYQCTVKRNGCWCMDKAQEIKCKILKITPIK